MHPTNHKPKPSSSLYDHPLGFTDKRQGHLALFYSWIVLTISATVMASSAKVSYQRLKQEGSFDENDDDLYNLREKVIGKVRSSSFRCRKVHIRKKMKIKIPSLRRLFRRKARLVTFAWNKIVKRLKESKSHFSHLFAGNYLFMQVTPTPLKCDDKALKGHDLHGLSSSSYSLPRIV